MIENMAGPFLPAFVLALATYPPTVTALGWHLFGDDVVEGYQKLAKSDVPFSALDQLPCPKDGCRALDIAAVCNNLPGCHAFNTNGSLKQYADCGWGSEYCVFPQGQPFPAADSVDLYIKLASAPPLDWRDGVVDGTMLYSQPEPNICEMPEVGNGYVASVVGFSSTHVAGLYYGSCGSTHKARLPTPIAGIQISNANISLTQAVLDTGAGMYRRRYHIDSGAVVEQRIYAHRVRPHVLVTEFEVMSSTSSPVLVNLSTLYDLQEDMAMKRPATCPNPGGRMVKRRDGTSYPYYTDCPEGKDSDCGECYLDKTCFCNRTVKCCQPGNAPRPKPLVGNGCAGRFRVDDIKWTDMSRSDTSVLTHTGIVAAANDNGDSPTVAIVVDRVPSSISLTRGKVTTLVAVVVASVGLASNVNVTNLASQEFNSIKYNRSLLTVEHMSLWASLTSPRIVVGGSNTSYRAWQLQTHFWSSYYYLMSTIRADWSLGGFSPGGLASQNYEGAVFMDQELYMAQGLLLFHPELTISAAQYRIDSAPAASRIAKTFGYDGMMFAWTSAAQGNPFGCCSGKGGSEDCIEQHITPDVSFFLQQIYRATGNRTWVKDKAWPVIQGIATWIVSRVEADPTINTTFHLRRVMPIDEWCNQASGCANPGVDDDPQMNGMTVAALHWAVEAADIVGVEAPKEWLEIAQGLVIPYDDSLGIHTMPVGANGISVLKAPHSTSCPEDINYLSYPLGPSLNISSSLTRRDMQYYADGNHTCMENAGMTAPIHAISWLKTVPPNVTGAEFALNRSMLAVTYGPFNMRNEVDVHSTIVGGHFNNTHFLTGDGGFIQILLNGYMGFMLARQDGMFLHRPVLPEDVSSLQVKGMSYLNVTLDVLINDAYIVFNTSQPGLCLFSPPAGRGQGIQLLTSPITVEIVKFFSGIKDDDNHGKIGPC